MIIFKDLSRDFQFEIDEERIDNFTPDAGINKTIVRIFLQPILPKYDVHGFKTRKLYDYFHNWLSTMELRTLYVTTRNKKMYKLENVQTDSTSENSTNPTGTHVVNVLSIITLFIGSCEEIEYIE